VALRKSFFLTIVVCTLLIRSPSSRCCSLRDFLFRQKGDSVATGSAIEDGGLEIKHGYHTAAKLRAGDSVAADYRRPVSENRSRNDSISHRRKFRARNGSGALPVASPRTG